MASKLLQAGRSLGAAQGGAIKAQGLVDTIKTSGDAIHSGYASYQKKIKEQQDQAAAEQLGAQLDIDPQIARSVGAEPLMSMLSQKRQADARDTHSRGLEELRARYARQRDKAEYEREDLANLAEQKNNALYMMQRGAPEGQARAAARTRNKSAMDSVIDLIEKRNEPQVGYGPDGQFRIPETFGVGDASAMASLARENREPKGSKPTSVQEYEYGLENPDFAAQQAQKSGGAVTDPRLKTAILDMLLKKEQAKGPVGETRHRELRRAADLLASSKATGPVLDRALPDQEAGNRRAADAMDSAMAAEASHLKERIAALTQRLTRAQYDGTKASDLRVIQDQIDELTRQQEGVLRARRQAFTAGYGQVEGVEWPSVEGVSGGDQGGFSPEEKQALIDALQSVGEKLGGR